MKNATDITVILDRSGSMANIVADMEGGFDSFITEQKKQNVDDVTVSLFQFDDNYQPVYEGVALRNVPKMRLIPGGSTALYDAIGRTIVATGARFRNLPESERPNKVVVLIITDGGENASREYRDPSRIRDMIKHQTDVYNWTFVFLGANQDAVFTAQTIGISANNSLTYASNSRGTKSAFDMLNLKTSSYRSAVSGQGMGATCMSFSNEDRDEQVKAGVNPSQVGISLTSTGTGLTDEQIAQMKALSQAKLNAITTKR